jgi:hypothetical protein
LRGRYSNAMSGEFSWVDLVALVVGVISLVVTLAIFVLGRRLSFRQQRDRVRELEAKALEVLRPIRTRGLNSKIIVMNVDRYRRGYDGSNAMSWRGYAFSGSEIVGIGHGGVEVINRAVESYYDARHNRTLAKGPTSGPVVLEIGHIPWTWIEDISPEGDEFDGSPIFFVRHRAPGRQPYSYLTYREGKAAPFGPNNRDYYPPLPELGTRRPQLLRDWWGFGRSLRQNRKIEKKARRAWDTTPDH